MDNDYVVDELLAHLASALKRLSLIDAALRIAVTTAFATGSTIAWTASLLLLIAWAAALYDILTLAEDLARHEGSLSALVYGSAGLLAFVPAAFIAVASAPLMGLLPMALASTLYTAGTILFATGVNRASTIAGAYATLESMLIAASIIIPILFPLGCYLAGRKIAANL